eukprot:TRINITY_DN7484_c0_g1_i4.p1 TRINITY_DN7484_c0_g1~~TRINITY_DN7484_c0_g1_i4.p1  ORF type:complete len:500 (+),score=87.27 TRINITY_DN7484_c0_g1_i4:126-1625(+)
MRRFTSPVSSSHQAKPSESPARPLLRSSDEAVTITRGSPGSSSEPVGSPTGLRDMRIEMVERPSRATTSEPQSQLGRSSSQSGTTGDTDAKLADALAQVAELTCQLALDRELNALLLEDNRNISQQLRDVTFERDQLLQRLHGSPAQRHGSPSAQRPSMLGSPTSRMVGSPALGARFASGVRRGSLDDSSRTHQLEAEIEQLKEFVLVQQREIAALHALAAREPRPLPRHDAAHPYSRSSSGSSGPHVDDGPSEAESAAAADTFAAFGVVDRPQPKEEVQALVREFSQISQHSSSRSLTGSSEGRFAAARSPSPDPARVRSPKAGAVTSTRAGAMVVEDFDLTEFDSPRPVVRRAAAGASPAQRPGSVEPSPRVSSPGSAGVMSSSSPRPDGDEHVVLPGAIDAGEPAGRHGFSVDVPLRAVDLVSTVDVERPATGESVFAAFGVTTPVISSPAPRSPARSPDAATRHTFYSQSMLDIMEMTDSDLPPPNPATAPSKHR